MPEVIGSVDFPSALARRADKAIYLGRLVQRMERPPAARGESVLTRGLGVYTLWAGPLMGFVALLLEFTVVVGMGGPMLGGEAQVARILATLAPA